MTAALPLALCGVVVTVTVLARLAASGSARSDAPRGQLAGFPWALRLLWRLSAPWQGAVERHLPPRLERRCRALLARADLHQPLDAARWIAMLTVSAALGAIALLVAWAAGLGFGAVLFSGIVGLPLLQHAWLRERAARRATALLKELPTLLELLVLCLEAGASLGVALRIAAEKSAPGPLHDLLSHLLQRIRAGQSRALALDGTFGQLDLEATTALATALVQAESSGMSLGPILRAQGEQVMTARFVRAERAAMQAPVKLLLPLLACIFPCTFIVIAVPIVSRLTGLAGP